MITVDKVVNRVSAKVFEQAVSYAKHANARIDENLSYYDVKDYQGMACFLTETHLSGFAVTEDDELVNLFSLEHRGKEMLRLAVTIGADNLNCYDGFLPKLYESAGFHVTKREPNWTPGGPDVVWMARDGAAVEVARDAAG